MYNSSGGVTVDQSNCSKENAERLVLLWTSGDRDTALNMVFMYAGNAKKRGWWDYVALVVWGPSSKLLAVDKELQRNIRALHDEGVELLACKACADNFKVSDDLAALGIEVKYMGEPLTNALKDDGWSVLAI